MFEILAGELRAKLGTVSSMRQVRSGRDTCAVAAGPGRTTSRRTRPHAATQVPTVWRAPEDPWAWLQYPRAAAGPGRATSRRPTLQTSSNQRNSNRLTRTPVTNVVNPSPKTTIISEKAIRLTRFVTTDQKSTQKTPRIDDVCNNTHPATRQRHSAAGVEGAGGICRGAGGRRRGLAGLTTHSYKPRRCGGRRRVRRARAGFEARRRTK